MWVSIDIASTGRAQLFPPVSRSAAKACIAAAQRSRVQESDRKQMSRYLRHLAEGEGFEPPVPFRVQWFSRPFMGGRSTSSFHFTPVKSALSANDLRADWGLSAQDTDKKR